MVRLVKTIYPLKDAVMQLHVQAGNITTNLKVKVYFALPVLSAKNEVMWNCHVGDSAKGRYDMISVRYLLSELELNFKFSNHVIESYDGHFKGYKTPVVDLVTYEYKCLNTGNITP